MIVLFEVVWTLEARYKVPSDVILDYLEALLATSGLVIIDRSQMEKAISISRKTGIEFPDAYVSVLAEEHQCVEIGSTNKNRSRNRKTDLGDYLIHGKPSKVERAN